MLISYKYRAYPDADTELHLFETIDTCRWLYNKLLEELNNAHENNIKLKKTDTQARIVKLKNENPFLNDVYSKVLQMVNYTLWSNIRGLSQTKKIGRNVGKLRYKSAFRYRTLNYNQSGFKIDKDHSIIKFSKIGSIPFKMHRDYNGKVKGILITHSKSGKWHVILQVETEISNTKKSGKSVGIDVGLNSFLVDSDGNDIENPRFYENSLNKIKKLQKSVSRKKRFSKNWKKAKTKLDLAYNHVINQKNDFLHKLSRSYVDTYATICIEDLNIKQLGEKGQATGLHRGIHSVSWGRFFSFLSYKAESAGTEIIKVDPGNTSQCDRPPGGRLSTARCEMCSQCGHIVKKTLSDRVHKCPYCGLVADRDYNASVNIHRLGMEQPFKSVERIPLHHISVVQVLSMKQEATSFRAW